MPLETRPNAATLSDRWSRHNGCSFSSPFRADRTPSPVFGGTVMCETQLSLRELAQEHQHRQRDGHEANRRRVEAMSVLELHPADVLGRSRATSESANSGWWEEMEVVHGRT